MIKYIEKYWIIIALVFIIFAFIKPSICFLILGLVFLIFSIESYKFNKYIYLKGVKCSAKILTYESDYEGHKTPIIEFKIASGEIISEKPYFYASTDFSKIRTYKNKINQNVNILYDPKNPKRFVIQSEEEFSYTVLMLFFFISIASIAIAICDLFGVININY
ncbi:DUF3592 domain-containing protein [Flavobacterium suncheonense]|uniref:DUF3592 domain-containing protein n=1 Tax=Flavobacterium suncheonense GH29-5 = DSM 17707 TaxID=1121899 RepID=A0A0A2M0B3_9FLAO|nr:DUF3592 domain-containing protein [Flavobacterium suncheonense]KGO85041.1 hypothetical protein Q764_14260 [Flavobacterium suncheonense GH29-5 = DSM 17707]